MLVDKSGAFRVCEGIVSRVATGVLRVAHKSEQKQPNKKG